MAGFIRIDRDIFEEQYFSEERYSRRMAFLDLCYLSAYKPYSFTIRGNEVTLQPMQLAKSADYLGTRWGWNRKTVYGFLDTLQNMGYIGLQKSRLVTVITIKKGMVDGLQIGLQNGQQNGLQSGLQNGLQSGLPYNNDNERKEREEYIITPHTPLKGGDENTEEALLEKIRELEQRVEELQNERLGATKTPEEEETATWKKDKSEYDRMVNEAKEKILADADFRKRKEELHLNIDFERTVENSADYWLSEVGWKKCKGRRSKKIDLVATIKNGFDKAKIYKSFRQGDNRPIEYEPKEGKWEETKRYLREHQQL